MPYVKLSLVSVSVTWVFNFRYCSIQQALYANRMHMHSENWNCKRAPSNSSGWVTDGFNFFDENKMQQYQKLLYELSFHLFGL